jgi:hypothetical protein
LRLFSHGPPPSGFVHQISLALSIIPRDCNKVKG